MLSRGLIRAGRRSCGFTLPFTPKPTLCGNGALRGLSSDSISYSGGQAIVGQGGFYGSGGNRKLDAHTQHKPEALGEYIRETDMDSKTALTFHSSSAHYTAHVEDVKTLANVMEKVEDVTAELNECGEEDLERMISLKGKKRKLVNNKEVMEILNRLYYDGEPVWGLSINERELVSAARRVIEDN